MKSACPHRIHGCLKLLVVMLVAMLVQAGAAWAHASLNSTSPADGSILGEAPDLYSLTFSEPVAPLSLLLVKSDGTSLQLESFVVKGNTVEIKAPEDLERGTHILTWRVVSADGHPVGGSVIFSVGEASSHAPVAREETDWTVRFWLWLSKVALYAGLFIGIGGVFARKVLMPEIDAGDRIIIFALAVGAAAATLSLGFQGLDVLGTYVGRLADPAIWSAGFSTSHGSTVIAALMAFALAGSALRLAGFPAMVMAVVAWLLGGLALALSGHASAASPQWLMRPAVFLHVAAIAVWIGALAPLGLALRGHQPCVVQALRRFSRAIPFMVAVLILAGITLGIVQVQQAGALLDTAYGWVFLIKLLLLVGLFLLAAANRWLLTSRAESGDTAATRRLVRSIAAETLIVLIIFGVAASWRFTPPPRALMAAAAAPVTAHIHTAKAMADLTVTPGRAGPVTVSAVIMTGEFDPLGAREVTFIFASTDAGIEPFRRAAERSNENTWLASDVVLPLAGKWQVRVDILISDFEIARLETGIEIGP